jgi:hypothetical protein
MKIGKSNSLIIIVGIVTALLVGSSYLFLQTSGAQRPTVAAKAPDTPKNLGETTLSQSAYPPSPVGANPTKIEGYRPPPYIHNVVQRQEGGETRASATVINSQPAPENDSCQNAAVISSFPSTVYGTTVGATIDCPGILDWNAVWYRFDVPYACNDITVNYCLTDWSISQIGMVLYDSCPPVCANYIAATGYQFLSCENGTTNPQMWWHYLPGPASYWIPVYPFASANFGFTVSVDSCVPCDVVCPPGAMLEGEPTCYDNYEDHYNGGCNSFPCVFQDVNCNTTICGTSGVYNYYGTPYRDSDWFRLVLTDSTMLTFKCVAEFPLLIFLFDAGSENGLDYTILGYTMVDICDTATISMWVPAGVYWFWVGPSDWGHYLCGVKYVAEIKCVSIYVRGDCNGDGVINSADVVYLINYLFIGGLAPVPLEAGDVNGDGKVDVVDIVYLINYLFIGGPPPPER